MEAILYGIVSKFTSLQQCGILHSAAFIIQVISSDYECEWKTYDKIQLLAHSLV